MGVSATENYPEVKQYVGYLIFLQLWPTLTLLEDTGH